MKVVTIKKVTGLFLLLASFQGYVWAQEKNDAINAFNEGVNLMKTDPVSAIPAFENCVKICDQIGDSANDIKEKAIRVIPDLYFQKASDLLLMDKKIDESLSASKTALKVSQTYNDTTAENKVKLLMVQAYSARASEFSGSDINKAVNAYDSALAINPHHLVSLFNKAMLYRKEGNTAKFGPAIDQYIAELDPEVDSAKIDQANKIALDYYRLAGGKANQANKTTEALGYLNSALKYGTDKNVYYHFANIYNKQKKYTEAAVNAQKGLDMENGPAEAKAKFYFELGLAQKGKNDTGSACESFTNAQYGPFVTAAKAERTNLKCK